MCLTESAALPTIALDTAHILKGRSAINSISPDSAGSVVRAGAGGWLSIRGVTAAFWVVLAALAVLQSLTFYNLARREQADRRQEASQQALLDLRTLRSDVRGARARERGFVLTGDVLDLDAYTQAVAAVDEDVKRLKELAEPTASAAGEIARLTEAALAEMDGVVRARRAAGINSAARHMQPGAASPPAIDRVEAAIAQASRAQEEATALRSSEEAAAVHRGAVTFAAVTGADLGLLAVGYWMLQRYAAHRRRVEAALGEAWQAAEGARAEAEAANCAKDRILATVSHDLRTPLNGILLWTELAKGAAVEPEVQEALAAIAESANAQARLVEDLLDASRTLGGALRIEMARVNFGEVVRRGCEAVRPTAEAKGVRLTIDVADEEPAIVKGDALRLQQVVWNIVGNAVKFTPAGGGVEVRLWLEGCLRLAVRDSGPGIERGDLGHVFEPFFQAEAPGGARAGGVGLGLAIVKQLVERHGGAVEVSSAGRGRGTTFTVTLPVSPMVETAAQDADRSAGVA
ncbi:MAG: Chemotaxis protein methyltransferase CheR [Phycisphaerales bacterium]|nr:Chemotaxis protein methyltransferase CheR [Phycisphaerales bacterium]